LSSQSAVFQKGRLGYLTVEVYVEAALRKLDSTAAAIQVRDHLKGAGDDILHRVKTGDNQLPWRVSIRIITKPWPRPQMIILPVRSRKAPTCNGRRLVKHKRAWLPDIR
jgi:hypothetical protein